MTILLTAFEPFGGETVNAALEAMKLVPDDVNGAHIVKVAVPTVFDTCAEALAQAVDAHEPDAVLCLGQAAGRQGLSVERIAINVDDARIPDNAGRQPVDSAICPEGPAAYFSTLPIKAMVSAIREAGLPAYVSNSAGTFVCNHLMYALLRELSLRRPQALGGFMHVPATPEQVSGVGAFGLPPQAVARGVTAALGAIASRLAPLHKVL